MANAFSADSQTGTNARGKGGYDGISRSPGSEEGGL